MNVSKIFAIIILVFSLAGSCAFSDIDKHPYENKNRFAASQNKELLLKMSELPRKDRFLYLKGKNTTSNKLNEFTILNCNFFALKNSESKREIEKILTKNPDILCLEGVFLNEDVNFLFSRLKENYAFFYVDIGSIQSGKNSGLFVASKFVIERAQMQFFQELPCFDFFVMNNQKETMGRVYLFDSQMTKNSNIEKFLESLKEDNLKSSIPVLICGNLDKDSKDLRTELPTFTWLLQERFFLKQNSVIKFKNWPLELNENVGIFSTVKKEFIKEKKSSSSFENIHYPDLAMPNISNIKIEETDKGIDISW